MGERETEKVCVWVDVTEREGMCISDVTEREGVHG